MLEEKFVYEGCIDPESAYLITHKKILLEYKKGDSVITKTIIVRSLTAKEYIAHQKNLSLLYAKIDNINAEDSIKLAKDIFEEKCKAITYGLGADIRFDNEGWTYDYPITIETLQEKFKMEFINMLYDNIMKLTNMDDGKIKN